MELTKGEVPIAANVTFSLRFFLAFCACIGVLCGLRQFEIAVWVFAYVILYVSITRICVTLVKLAPISSEARVRRLASTAEPILDVPTIVALSQLLIFYIWHVLIVMTHDFGGALQGAFWTPVWCGLSLYSLQQAGLILSHVFVYAKLFGDCYGTGVLKQTTCHKTASLSLLLFLSHFAHPWVPLFWPWKLWLVFGLNPAPLE